MLRITANIASKIKKAKVLLLGCSAGGFNIIYDLLTSLTTSFPLAVVVVIHRSRNHKSGLEELLAKKGNLPVKSGAHGLKMERGMIYIAPPDFHLLLEPHGDFALDYSEPVYYCRPAIDVTFESVADVHKENVIAILFSGANEDGAEGLYYAKRQGALTVVQDPECAQVKTMPEAAIRMTKTHLVLKDDEIFKLMHHIVTLNNIHE